MANNISIPYKVITEKFISNSFDGEIEIKKARRILAHYFRFPKGEISKMLTEMKEKKIISLNKFSIIILLSTPNGTISQIDKSKYYR